MSSLYSRIALTLCVGSLGTLVPKFLLSTPCPGPSDPTLHAPLFAATCVFLASSLCLVVPLSSHWLHPSASPPLSLARYRPLLLPSLFNALGTILQLCSLLFLPAAVLAGLRGLFILWTAQLSHAFRLKDAPATRTEWRCIYLCLLGALAVGGGALSTSSSSADAGAAGSGGRPTLAMVAAGLLLAALGYASASLQVVTEQLLLDGSHSRWEILGVEGAASTLLTLALMGALQAAFSASSASATSGQGIWAALDVPSHTLACARASAAVPALAAAYGAVGITFNTLLLTVAKDIGPNMRVLVFTARGVLTWGVEVALFYAGGLLGVPGTPLDAFSSLELLGFAALIGGGALRARVVAQRASSGGEGEGVPEEQLVEPLISVNSSSEESSSSSSSAKLTERA